MIRMILTYLVKHPAAKDTTEGIAAWWISIDQEAVAKDKDDVQEAIKWLVWRGWMATREGTSQKTYGFV